MMRTCWDPSLWTRVDYALGALDCAHEAIEEEDASDCNPSVVARMNDAAVLWMRKAGE